MEAKFKGVQLNVSNRYRRVLCVIPSCVTTQVCSQAWCPCAIMAFWTCSPGWCRKRSCSSCTWIWISFPKVCTLISFLTTYLLAFTLFFPCLFLLAGSFKSSFLFNVALVSRLLNIMNCLPSDVLCFAFQEDLKWVSHALDLYLLMHWTWSLCIFLFSFLGVDWSTQSFPAADFFKVLITEKTLKG